MASPLKTSIEDGVYFLGDPIQEKDNKTWYNAVELEPFDETEEGNFVVKVGDDVLVENDEHSHLFVIRVTELFIDHKRNSSLFKGRWFYRAEDTILMIKKDYRTYEMPISDEERKSGLDPRRLWLAESDDSEDYQTENSICSINKLVYVLHVNPGDPIPDSTECDFWYNQTHSRQYYTFKDLYKTPSKRREPLMPCIRVLDLFCGCGGLSFIDQKEEEFEIKTTHAVDLDADAILTYRSNNPEVETYCSSVEEFLMLCMHFDRIATECSYDVDIFAPSPKKIKLKDDVSISKILDIKLKHNVPMIDEGQGMGQLSKELSLENSSIVFKCERREDRNKITLSAQKIIEHPKALTAFLRTCKLPRPGDIELIVGGPPCQGVSGLNRHAQQTDVLNCSRNRLVKSYFRCIEFFKPKFTLMENVQACVLAVPFSNEMVVQDIMRKQDGAYAKYATAKLLSLGYQSRLGLLASGNFGAAQYRWRCFLWGALSGIPLPPFPEPVFSLIGRSAVANSAKSCEVKFLSKENEEKAFPMVLNGDILSDLPEVSNFCLTNALLYKSEPQTPIQAWLRRKPDAYQRSLQERADEADVFMNRTQSIICEAIEQKKADAEKHRQEASMKVAELVLMGGGADRQNDFAGEIRDFYLNKVIPKMDNPRQELDAIAERKSKMMKEHGNAVLENMAQIGRVPNSAPNLVRDHRPKICNSDDYYRIQNVPKKEGSNFRQMKGVQVNAMGTACAGHTHAFKNHGCRGGGVVLKPKRSIYKESRIDHADKDGWRGIRLEGCPSWTEFTPTMNLLCPRWCITFKNGYSQGRHGCFGRIRRNSVQPTVVTRAEPHNLEICHPEQDRVLTIREMARCQGFPDYYVFVGTDNEGKRSLVRLNTLENRYKQIGNAVSPPVAAALGRCLLFSVSSGGRSCSDPVITIVDDQMMKTIQEAREKGLRFYSESPGHNVEIKEGSVNDEDDDEYIDIYE